MQCNLDHNTQHDKSLYNFEIQLKKKNFKLYIKEIYGSYFLRSEKHTNNIKKNLELTRNVFCFLLFILP